MDVLAKVKAKNNGLDVRECVLQPANRAPLHAGEKRSPQKLYASYEFDQSMVAPPPSMIAIFDDVLTTGASFKAMQRLLREKFPSVPIVGVFVARVGRGASLP